MINKIECKGELKLGDFQFLVTFWKMERECFREEEYKRR